MVRYHVFDIGHRRVLKNAGRVAVRHRERSVRRHFLRVLINAGELHRQAVCKGHMAVKAVDENRIVRRDGVDHRGRRQIVRLPILVVPLPAEYPSPLRQFRGKILYSLDKFFRRFSRSQIDGRKLRCPSP